MPSEIRWRVHLASPPEAVWALIATDDGREQFWGEAAVERDGAIEFRFPDGTSWRGKILESEEPRRFAVDYFGTAATFELNPDGERGTDVTLTHGVTNELHAEVNAGWVSVLMALKAAADFGIDLRNHDVARTWSQGYCDN